MAEQHVPALSAVRLGSAVAVPQHSVEASSYSQTPTFIGNNDSGSDEGEKYNHSHDVEKGQYSEKGGYPEGRNLDDSSAENYEPIDVEKSKAQFTELSRRLSQTSNLHRSLTNGSHPGKDVEKAEQTTDEDQFDLLSWIRGQTEQADQQGVKHKKLAVVWDHLRVIGGGGLKVS